MRRFDPGPRLQTFWSFPSELNGLGEIIGSLSIVSDGLKSASIGVEGGQKADTELFEVLATRPAPSRSISKRLSSNLRMACCLCSAVGWLFVPCLLYTSDAADDLLCVDLGGRRIIKKK